MVSDENNLAAYTSRNNRFVRDSYQLGNPSGVHYQWYAGGGNYVDMTRFQWTAAGQDVSGTWLPAGSVPSSQFASGNAVTVSAGNSVRSLPTTSASLVNVSAGAQGTVTKVRGPIYSDGAVWWQVLWNNGVTGWAPATSLTLGGGGGGGGSIDTTPPTLGISYPQNNSTVSGVVPVSVVVNDDVRVTQVRYYVNGQQVGTSTAAPWGLSWNTSSLSNGSHLLAAYAYDAAGNSGGGAITVSVSGGGTADTTRPTLGISYPHNNSTVSGVVPVSVIAADNVGITQVRYFVDGVPVGTSSAAPWGFSWNTASLSSGSHVLTAYAYDAAGNSGGGAISVFVAGGSDTTRPTLGISYPRNNSTVSGVVPVSVIASDNVGVVQVRYFVDGVLVGTSTAAPWSFSWNTSSLSSGPHALVVYAYDAAGNSGGGAITVFK
jgi:hypothetical protein